MTKPGRNDACPCGSGKKYKQCCLRTAPSAVGAPQDAAIAAIQAAIQSHQAGRLTEAEAYYRRAIGLLSHKQDIATAHNSLGVVLKELGKTEEACLHFSKAISLKLDFSEAHNNLGNIFLEQRNVGDAVACFQKALSINPGNADFHNNLGNAYSDQCNFNIAVDCYRKAILLRPTFAKAHGNMSDALWKNGELEEALLSARRAISLDPANSTSHNVLGNLFCTQGKLDEAIASYRVALTIKPDYSAAQNNLGNALRDQGKFSEAIASYRKALLIKPNYSEAYSNLLFAHTCHASLSSNDAISLARGWERSCVSTYDQKIAINRIFNKISLEGRRLKIGYVSPDFRRHAVAFFIEPILASHDKRQFEVFCYYNHIQKDEFTARLEGYAEHWFFCNHLNDEQLANRIFADGLDVLIDLAGHTANSRMQTFALRPAPIQLTYLGYPGTSGISAMDYRLTDGFADPPGSEAHYTEKLLRMPDSLCCYRPGKDIPEISTLPAQSNGYVTFGSFNNFNKINDECLELWARVLRAVPASRLLMLTVPEGASRVQLIDRFRELGVTAERLEFFGKLAQREFFRACQMADIALDPISVTGGTTTCETLWLGIPVVVLIGERYITRVGYSFLNAAGMSELAAKNADDYVQIAANLAGDLPRLAQTRAGLRVRMAGSSLMDEEKFTRNLEKIYLETWEKWYSTPRETLNNSRSP